MNWGYKILLVYAVFVIGIVFMVYSASAKKIDLVTPDYYEQELKYQQTIDAARRANRLSGSTVCEVKDDSLLVFLPVEMQGRRVAATVLLYCIANKDRDLIKSYDTETAVLKLKLPEVNKGMHDIKINWMADDSTYYHEQKILLP